MAQPRNLPKNIYKTLKILYIYPQEGNSPFDNRGILKIWANKGKL